MFELKPLNREAIPAALEKANRYRLLNEPGAAESIYLDILAIDPDNQEALVNIVLAMSDRFSKDYAVGDGRIQDFLSKKFYLAFTLFNYWVLSRYISIKIIFPGCLLSIIGCN